jgi:hypothetical protein
MNSLLLQAQLRQHGVRVEVLVPVMVRQPVRAIKVRMHVLAAE